MTRITHDMKDAAAAMGLTTEEGNTTTVAGTPKEKEDTTTTTTTTTTTMTAPTTTMSVMPETADENVVPAALLEQNYYHGLLPREDLKELLNNTGDFVVRLSQPTVNEQRQIIISVLVDKKPDKLSCMRHIVVRRIQGKYQVEDTPRFSSMNELIDYLIRERKECVSFVENSYLVTPIARKKWELRHSDIELSKRLGYGQFGEVHKGKLKRFNRVLPVAVKFARVSATSKEHIKEMMREARLMRNFNHPNVVKIYGIALDNDPIMIVMELVRGGSLDEYLRKHAGRITEVEKMTSMVSGAAWGLTYLHDKRVIHRDVAARNCLYDKNKVVKISDFGLSREGDVYKMLVTRRVPIKWISPEVLINFTYTRASDVFSFGVMCWEIATDGADPFQDKKTAEIREILLSGGRLEWTPNSPPDLVELVTKHCWGQRTEERVTMIELTRKLENLTGVKQPVRERHPHKYKDDFSGETVAAPVPKRSSLKSRERLRSIDQPTITRTQTVTTNADEEPDEDSNKKNDTTDASNASRKNNKASSPNLSVSVSSKRSGSALSSKHYKRKTKHSSKVLPRVPRNRSAPKEKEKDDL